MNLIEQTNDWNSGSAIMATLLGMDSCEKFEKEVLRRSIMGTRDTDDNPIAIAAVEMDFMLWLVGVNAWRWTPHDAWPKNSFEYKYMNSLRTYTSVDVTRFMNDSHTVIMNTQSLVRTAHHWIMISDKVVYDPDPEAKYDWDMFCDGSAPIPVFTAILIQSRHIRERNKKKMI